MTSEKNGCRARRSFLRRAIAGGAAWCAAPYVISPAALGNAGRSAPSERITIGFIGLGSHGIGHNLRSFLRQNDAEPVILCDVDTRQIEAAVHTVRQQRGESFDCATTRDWREVIAREDVDAVMISTGDQWHGPMSVGAIQAGKDVMCEKPTLNIAEGRIVADLVRRYGTVFQTATEDRSIPVYHRMAELVRNGRIGRLERIFCQLPGGPGNAGDPRPQPVPAELDWDMWLGPAPWAPYRQGLHPYHWRWHRDYSGGQLTDWGAHQLDTVQWANDTEHSGPVEVEGTGRRHENGLYDTFFEYHLVYRYADGVELRVDSGGTGLRFEGSDGWVGNDGWVRPLQASSDAILASVSGPEEISLFTEPRGEHRNFLDCVKSRRDPYFPAEIGHRCSTLSHLGNIAMELGRKLRWDPVTEAFDRDDTANRMRSRSQREPWSNLGGVKPLG